MDEFFLKLGGDGGGTKTRWTWERAGAVNVAIRDQRVGVTSSVTTAASGDAVLLQFIYRGTERLFSKHVDVDDRVDVLQCARADSHFQNAATFAAWLERFIRVVDTRRERGEPALLLLDAAAQHEGAAARLAAANILFVPVPPKQTHVFQAADQFVIANLKSAASGLYKNWASLLFARNDVLGAATAITTNSVTTCRARKVEFVAAAFRGLGGESIVRSWQRTGVVRALFNEPYPHVVYDTHEEMALLLGEQPVGEGAGEHADDFDVPQPEDLEREEELLHQQAAAMAAQIAAVDAQPGTEAVPAVPLGDTAPQQEQPAADPPVGAKRGRPRDSSAERATKEAARAQKAVEAAKKRKKKHAEEATRGMTKLDVFFARKAPVAAATKDDEQ